MIGCGAVGGGKTDTSYKMIILLKRKAERYSFDFAIQALQACIDEEDNCVHWSFVNRIEFQNNGIP